MKTSIYQSKIDGWMMKFPFNTVPFSRGHVNSRGAIWNCESLPKRRSVCPLSFNGPLDALRTKKASMSSDENMV